MYIETIKNINGQKRKIWEEFLNSFSLDADEIINMKMDQNEAKYPVEKVKGRSDKYNRY